MSAALVTGGADRLGRALALRLAAMGYDLALHYRHSAERAEATRAEIRRRGAQCSLHRADFEQPQAATALMAEVAATCSLSVLVNNASLFIPSTFPPPDDVPLDPPAIPPYDKGGRPRPSQATLDRMLAVNVRAPYALTAAFARRASEGVVVNILDARIAGLDATHFDYVLSRKWLAEFTRLAALSLGPRIRVVGIAPGPILPPPGGSQEDLQAIASAVPLARPGDPEAVCAALEYLLRNTYVTGEITYVDGGRHLQG